jgi:hypothetical protein
MHCEMQRMRIIVTIYKGLSALQAEDHMLQVQPKWDVFDLFLSKIHDRHQGFPLGDAEDNINTAIPMSASTTSC